MVQRCLRVTVKSLCVWGLWQECRSSSYPAILLLQNHCRQNSSNDVACALPELVCVSPLSSVHEAVRIPRFTDGAFRQRSCLKTENTNSPVRLSFAATACVNITATALSAFSTTALNHFALSDQSSSVVRHKNGQILPSKRTDCFPLFLEPP